MELGIVRNYQILVNLKRSWKMFHYFFKKKFIRIILNYGVCLYVGMRVQVPLETKALDPLELELQDHCEPPGIGSGD